MQRIPDCCIQHKVVAFCLGAAQFGIECVAQGIAQEVEAAHGDEDVFCWRLDNEPTPILSKHCD